MRIASPAGEESLRPQCPHAPLPVVAFGAICFFSLFYVHEFVPETHMLSLEQIEAAFEAHRQHRATRSFSALLRRRRKTAAEAAPVEIALAAPVDGDEPPAL